MHDSDSKFRRHAAKIQTLVDSVLNSRGDSDPELRRAVELRAATHAGRLPEGGAQLPQELGNYVDKIARHAYLVADADIEALRTEGLSDEAIEGAIHVTTSWTASPIPWTSRFQPRKASPARPMFC